MEDKGTLVEIDLTRELHIADEVEVILGDYEFVLKDGKAYFVKKKPKYPKTYTECYAIVGDEYRDDDIIGYRCDLLTQFQRLLVCRDAYWKLAGDEMGLGKPWEPDWDNENEYKYGFFRLRNIIYKDATCIKPILLVFPTEEMRDAFYENFKDLIDACKELL